MVSIIFDCGLAVTEVVDYSPGRSVALSDTVRENNRVPSTYGSDFGVLTGHQQTRLGSDVFLCMSARHRCAMSSPIESQRYNQSKGIDRLGGVVPEASERTSRDSISGHRVRDQSQSQWRFAGNFAAKS